MLTPKESSLLARELDIIKIYRENPVLAAQDLLGVDLAVPQRAILNSMWKKDFVLVTAGRGCGKSFMTGVFSVLWALLYPGQKIGLLAPSFRQGKTMFAEVEKLWRASPLLREATEGKPTLASDRCYLKFKQGGNTPCSIIEAIPLGDGSKIRGARYYVIIVDEFAQMPEQIFKQVILPMGATVANPMENVRKLAKIDKLIKSGKAKSSDFQEKDSNKVVMLSSAYYQFNHMYNSILAYQRLINEGNKAYAVHTIAYTDMPKGFLDIANITSSKASLSEAQFNMEYGAIWEADSSGVFKATLIEKCKGLEKFTVSRKGIPGKEYILGLDPARESDAFAMCILQVGNPNRVVSAWEFYKVDFPKMASTIINLCTIFNVIAVHMDIGAGGGGNIMKDLLAEEERFGTNRILDITDDSTVGQVGNRILYCFAPSSKSNADAVNATLSLMEHNELALPQSPVNISGSNHFEELEDIYETASEMLRQVTLIEVTQTKSGIAHFDVPTGGGHGKQKKDLFTAFILACKKAYDLTMYVEEEINTPILGVISGLPGRSNPILNNTASSSLGPSYTKGLDNWTRNKGF